MSTPEWLFVGAPVAEFGFQWQRHGSATYATVARIGKRDVVLDNGSRYNVNTLSRRVGGSYGVRWDLLPREDPQVQRAVQRQRRLATYRDVIKRLDEWQESGSTSELQTAIDLLARHQPAEQGAV